MSAERYLATAQNLAQVMPGMLVEQGLDPLINRYVLAESQRGDAWLFVVLDDSAFKSLAAYSAKNVLTTLSASTGGHPVFFSNSFGLRYAILLSPPRRAPEANAAFP